MQPFKRTRDSMMDVGGAGPLALHKYGPDSNPRLNGTCGLSLVLGFDPAPRVFLRFSCFLINQMWHFTIKNIYCVQQIWVRHKRPNKINVTFHEKTYTNAHQCLNGQKWMDNEWQTMLFLNRHDLTFKWFWMVQNETFGRLNNLQCISIERMNKLTKQ